MPRLSARTLLNLNTVLCLISLVSLSCGVRGRPQPPDEPAFIGRGSRQMIVDPIIDDKPEETVQEP